MVNILDFPAKKFTTRHSFHRAPLFSWFFFIYVCKKHNTVKSHLLKEAEDKELELRKHDDFQEVQEDDLALMTEQNLADPKVRQTEHRKVRL